MNYLLKNDLNLFISNFLEIVKLVGYKLQSIDKQIIVEYFEHSLLLYI